MNHTLHLADGDLVRYLDHELAGREFRDAMQHLARCMTCEHRLDQVREQSEAVSALLRSETARPTEAVRAEAWTAVEQAAWRNRRYAQAPALGRWRAAAVVALLLAGTVAIHAPLRAWVTEQLASIVGSAVQPEPRRTQPMPEAVSAPRALGSAVSFVPAAAVFTIEFDHVQRDGELRISVRDVATASAREIGGSGAELLVLPASLRVANDPASGADYEIVLPAAVRELQIRVGKARISAVGLETQTLPWSHTFSLR